MNEGASVSDGELGQSVTTTIPTTITDNNNQQRTVRGTNVANHGTSVHTVEIDTHTQQCPPANEHGTSHSDYGRRNGDPAVGTVRSNSPGPIRRKRYHDPSTRVPCHLYLSTERDDTLTDCYLLVVLEETKETRTLTNDLATYSSLLAVAGL
jgi:hypothetical protein